MSEIKHDFGVFLQERGFFYESVPDGNITIYKIPEYEIPSGRYAGKVIGIGIPMPPDFTTTAPYGLHVKSNGMFTEPITAGDKQSILGVDWKFWSRSVNNWNDPQNRNYRYYFDHVNRWLEVS